MHSKTGIVPKLLTGAYHRPYQIFQSVFETVDFMSNDRSVQSLVTTKYRPQNAREASVEMLSQIRTSRAASAGYNQIAKPIRSAYRLRGGKTAKTPQMCAAHANRLSGVSGVSGAGLKKRERRARLGPGGAGSTWPSNAT
jgi:hypothetical protein